METPLREYWIQKDGLLPKETRAFEAGFIIGLDHSAARLAALQAENAKLRAALKPFAEAATLVFIEPKIRTLPIEAEYLVEARRALEPPTT